MPTDSARNPVRTLYRGGPVYSPATPGATALLTEGERVTWLGDAADAPAADTVLDLDGALVTPAFVDAHVHATDTGISLLSLDLSGSRSPAEVLDRVAAAASALPTGGVLLGHGWDESSWPQRRPPTAAELDRAAGGRAVYLSQASIHSAACSSALLAAAPQAADQPGYDPRGWQRRDAHHVVREVALASLTQQQRRDAQVAMLTRAASVGVGAVHECGGPGTSDEADFTGLLTLAAEGDHPEVYGYWGELGAVEKARELGAVGAGGDLYADGALGAQTAHLREPYRDTGDCGHGYLSADQVVAHIVKCTDQNMQGGFHAIGDHAIATVLAGFALAAARVGLERVRAMRHRVEHVEIIDKQLIGGFVNFGLVASMQPAFDRLWGGTDGMYSLRLGKERSLDSNPFAALAGVGVPLAFGSDSPVTPLDPWGSVRAATAHHNPAHRMGVQAAFAAHTRGGWRAIGNDDDGVLVPGGSATFAVWRDAGELTRGLPQLDADTPLPSCVRTVVRGRVIYEEGAAS